jgi:hypothetical protein
VPVAAVFPLFGEVEVPAGGLVVVLAALPDMGELVDPVVPGESVFCVAAPEEVHGCVVKDLEFVLLPLLAPAGPVVPVPVVPAVPLVPAAPDPPAAPPAPPAPPPPPPPPPCANAKALLVASMRAAKMAIRLFDLFTDIGIPFSLIGFFVPTSRYQLRSSRRRGSPLCARSFTVH